jgi:hypothetical protein
MLKKISFSVIVLLIISMVVAAGCTDSNSRTYVLNDSTETKPATPTPAPAPSTGQEMVLTIKGTIFKDAKVTLVSQSFRKNEADGVNEVIYKGMIEKDSVSITVNFIDTKPGKNEIAKMSGKGSGKNSFSLVGNAPGTDPGSKYFFEANAGEIVIIENSAGMIKGTFKGGATDIRAENPTDITFEGSFSIQSR